MAENQEGPILANWQCHKIVAAGKIVEVFYGTRAATEEGNAPVKFAEALRVETADGTACATPVCPGDAFFARGEPAIGDYLVKYEDGYLSWSPAKAFEDGYTKING